jgi:hypothetical protein
MPISLTPFTESPLVHGHTWAVDDVDALAVQVGRVALGEWRHVERILAGAGLGPPTTSATQVTGAIALLTQAGDDPWHRDGWMFQAMSWIAALKASPHAIVRPPHMILADKGFDGLQLEFDQANQSLVAAIVFEDKATDNPRTTIRNEVWPEFSSLEAGDRDNVLTSEITSLLRAHPGIDADNAIQSVVWQKIRRYRVCITVGQSHSDRAGRKRLFKEYDIVAVGAVDRRRGETFFVADLRPWMNQLADKAIESVRAWGAINV